MAYIDKISVNGSERDLRDAGAARFDETQALTDAQKQAARANVGAASAADVTALAGRVTAAEGDIDDLEAAVDTKADTADVTALTTVVAGKVDTQQGVSFAGKALVVGSDGAVTLGDAGVPAAVAEALLACFRNVAWINWQESGQSFYNALEDALGVHTMSYGVYEPEELVTGRYIDTDGQIKDGTAGQSYYIADYIPVVASSYWIALQPSLLRVSGGTQSTSQSTSLWSETNWRVAEYDANKNFIKLSAYQRSTGSAYSSRVVTFDANTRYMRLGWYDPYHQTVSAFEIENPSTLTELPMELGDVNATSGENAVQPLRIRTTGYIAVSGGVITLTGCPFADSWEAFNDPIMGGIHTCTYGVRCYDSTKNYLGYISDLPNPIADIENHPLLQNTAFVRLIMQFNGKASFDEFKYLANHLIAINGINYYVTGV